MGLIGPQSGAMDAGAGMTAQGQQVVVFGFDITEASQIKSIRAMISAGCDVESLAFKRGNMNAGFVPDWPHVCLGKVGNGRMIARGFAIMRGIWRCLFQRERIAAADIIIARNLDLLLIALIARFISGSSQPVIYQCLDIHAVFTNSGIKGRIARWLERQALGRIDRLVVSSEAFLKAYFEPVQHYVRDSIIVENRIFWSHTAPARPVDMPRQPGPLRLGWVGTLRCPKSLALLAAAAAQMGSDIEIILRGVVHRHNLPDFDNILKNHPNIHLEGAYSYPDGLAQAYAGLDMVWAQDLWQVGANSTWLLPNRIYEAGYFCCPCIAIAGTQTAVRVERDRLGFVLPNANAASLIQFLRTLSSDNLAALRNHIGQLPVEMFVSSDVEVHQMLDFKQQVEIEGVSDGSFA